MEIVKTGVGSLKLSGRLDTVTAPMLQTDLTKALEEAEKIELDFTDVAYVSSAGLRVLLSKKARKPRRSQWFLKTSAPK